MEKRTKHRILGMLVFIGIAVILFPFFQHGKGPSGQTILVQAPPFPNQPARFVSQDSMPALQQDAGGKTNQKTIQIQLSKSDLVESEMRANRLDATEVTTNFNTDKIKTSRYRIIEGEQAEALLKKIAAHKKRKNHPVSSSVEKTSTEHDNIASETHDLASLQKGAWVIQVGSYREKSNALHMTNQLRSKGYHAFIQQTATVLGEHTRVFVGPEDKQSAARTLAKQLQLKMHIKGIVTYYQPLTLRRNHV